MTTYNTYQQLAPVLDGEHWQPNIKYRGDVEASSEEVAIAIARQMEVFRRASGLARWPLVEEAI